MPERVEKREPHALREEFTSKPPQPLGKCLKKKLELSRSNSPPGRISGQTNSERHAAQGPGRAARRAARPAGGRGDPRTSRGARGARQRGACALEHDSGAANSATARPRGTPGEPPRNAPAALTGN